MGWAQAAGWYLPQIASQMPYYRLNPDEDGELRNLFLDYDQRITDLQHAHEEWRGNLLSIGMKHFRGVDLVNPPMELLSAVGPKPAPLEPVFAAKAGDPWMLGFSNVMPKWAEKFFLPRMGDDLSFMREAEDAVTQGAAPSANPGQQYRDFMAEKRREGMDLAEIGALWRERSKLGDRAAVAAG